MSRILKYLLFALAIFFVFTSLSIGDVGNFNDYGSGSSWSDSSSGWGSSSSSWDSGSSSWGSSYSSNRRYSDSQRNIESSDLVIIIVMMLFLAVMYGINNIWKLGRPPLDAQMPVRNNWTEVPNHTLDITEVLQESDPDFNAAAFLEWAKEVFYTLQYAWMDREWEQVRPFESEELYATHARQLQEYRRLGRINIIERININNAYFFSLVKDQKWETLSVAMYVRMVDYIIDEHTRQVLKGTPDRDCFMSYLYIFKRKSGVKTTSAKQGVGTIACPNCGAPTHVVSSGRCEYCNFVITVKDHGWVLSDIVGIKPPYNYGPGGVIMKNKSEE